MTESATEPLSSDIYGKLNLAACCRKENYVFSNSFSDTYRISCIINGTKVEKDIVHISLPFDNLKEADLKARYGMTDIDLLEFYASFGENIKNAWKIENDIRNCKVGSIREISLLREAVSILPKQLGPGSDIFILYPSAEPVTECGYLPYGEASLHNILTLGKQMLMMANQYSEAGLDIGYFNPEQIVLAVGDDNEVHFKNAGFLYARYGSNHGSIPVNIRERNQTNDNLTERNGDFSALRIMTALLQGQNYIDCFNLEKTPEYLTRNFRDLLETYNADFRNGKGIGQLIYACETELTHCQDKQISFVSMLPEPDFTPSEHIGDSYPESEAQTVISTGSPKVEAPAANQQTKPKTNSSNPEATHKKGWKKSAILVGGGLLIAVSLCTSLRLIKGTPEPVPLKPKYSADEGLYLLSGKVVDADGQTVSRYSADQFGNILDSSNRIIYTTEFVSGYPVIEDISFEIISKDFHTLTSVSDFDYRTGILIIDSTIDYEYSASTGMLSVPEYFASANRVRDGLIAVVRCPEGDCAITVRAQIGSDSEHIGNLLYEVDDAQIENYRLRQGSISQLLEAEKNDEQAKEIGDGWLGGEWTYFGRISVIPEDLPDPTYILAADGNDACTVSVNGESLWGSAVLSPDDETILTIRSRSSEPCILHISASTGNYSEDISIEFEPGIRELPIPEDMKPAPTPTPTPAPTSSPVPTPSATPYTNDIVQHREEPVSETSLEVGFTEPDLFTVEPNTTVLQIGETISVVTSGDDGGFIRATSSDMAVAAVDVARGIDGSYTVTAVGKGTCTIIFDSLKGTRIVAISVE